MPGMNESEIKQLCNPKNAKGFKLMPYWTSEIYGFGKWIRDYAHYPKFLPLCIYTDHGPMTLDDPLKEELESGAPYQFYHSLGIVKRWKRISKTEAFTLYSPFVHCRKKLDISQSTKANGTLSFPAHTTIDIDEVSDMEVYIKQLLKLPRKFQPVSVCLYYNDIAEGKHKLFQKYNIPVYTAGYPFDERFAERFYEILKNFKYATSNFAGSYLYYVVEMGIPFFLYGQKQKLINKSDPNISAGEYDPEKISTGFRKVSRMFTGPRTKNTKKEKKFVETGLGLRDGVRPEKMHAILYKALFMWIFSLRLFVLVAKLLRKLVVKNLLQKQPV